MYLWCVIIPKTGLRNTILIPIKLPLQVFSTCSNLLGSKGESPLTRLTAASLIPGGACNSVTVADELSEAAVFASASEDESTVGCLGELLKILSEKII